MLEIKVLPDTGLNTQGMKRGPSSSQTDASGLGDKEKINSPAASLLLLGQGPAGGGRRGASLSVCVRHTPT